MAAQSDFRYLLNVSGDSTFDVISFDLEEELSSLYYLSLSLASKDDSIDFSSIIDRPATLTFYQDNQIVRHVNGIVTELEQKKTGFHRTFYRMTIQPALSRADLQSDCRIFQDMTTQDIVSELLKKNGIESFRFLHTEHYWPREYCVQYNETDLAFIERLLAEDGTYYYFEHSADDHVLCLTNTTRLAQDIGEVEYNATPATGERPAPCLREFLYRQQIAASVQTQRDYTFRNPGYTQEHSAYPLENDPQGSYEKYLYPGRYKRDAQGEPFTRYRLEHERREAVSAIAKGDQQKLLTGFRFTLYGHAREDMNTEWLVIRIKHRGEQAGVLDEEAGQKGNHYHNQATLIPADRQWRPTPTMKPRIDGPQIGHVVGPEGEEIYCDEWGRVKIQFPWDRLGKSNEFSSCWIRVSQAWAGAHYGNIAIPRIGHEVIVDFLEGDPDQPIVTGRTYHQTTPPPYRLPKHKTRMSIKSKTHKGDGFNEMRFEDEKDQEEIFIHAQKDQNNIVNNDESTQVGHDRSEVIGHDEFITITNNRTEKVGVDEDLTVGQDQHNSIGRDQRNQVLRNRITKIHKDERIDIGNHRTLDVYADQLITTGADYKHTVSGKTVWESGKSLRQLSAKINTEGYDEVRIASRGGTIIINDSGITLKGKVTIKGSLAIVGGAPEMVDTLSLAANQGEELCMDCLLKKQGKDKEQ